MPFESRGGERDMTTIKSLWFTLSFLFLAVAGAIAQETPPPGSMKLLPGYHHQRQQGIDSTVGTIWKQSGLKIEYDIGEMAGNYAECTSCGWTTGEVWRKKQTVGERKIVLVFTSKKMLVVSFPESHANFYAIIQSQDEMADMLLMLFTFSPTPQKNAISGSLSH